MRNSKDSVYFMAVKCNKKRGSVNLKTDREVIYEFAKICDVLVENYVQGKLDALGLSYGTLKTIAPSSVYCSITGFGSQGKEAKRWRTAHEGIVPFEAFETQTGLIILGCGSDAQSVTLYCLLGVEELAHDVRFRYKRTSHQPQGADRKKNLPLSGWTFLQTLLTRSVISIG
uniref:Uncharacterized protein n=1 Tax=Anopheles farauti TaxID=69004 RepID=A0A182Q300_9DIPT